MRLSPHVFETLELTFLFLHFVCRHTDSTQRPLPRIASRTYVFVSFRPTYCLSALFRKWSHMSLVQPSPFWFRYNVLVLRKWERLPFCNNLMVNKHKAQGNFSFQIKLLIRKAHGLQRMRDTLVQTSLRIFTYNRKN